MSAPVDVLRMRAVIRELREEIARLRVRAAPKPRRSFRPRPVADGGEVKHGTDYAYEHHGCRCDDCRNHHNARVRRNRAERLARLRAGDGVHGSRSSYDAGCRCPACRRARLDADKRAAYRRWAS